MSENLALFMIPRFSIKGKVPNPKTSAFEDVYFPPVATKASRGRTLNTNKLHNIEKLLKNNQHLFFFVRKKLHS